MTNARRLSNNASSFGGGVTSSLPSRARRATLPASEHIALMLARLQIIAPAKFLATERLLIDVLKHAEDDHRRRFHRPKTILKACLLWACCSGLAC